MRHGAEGAPRPRKGTESHLTIEVPSHSLLSARAADIGLSTKGAHMPTRSLPPRPDLAQLKRQANELHKLHREGKQSAAARIIANHPRLKRASPRDVLDTKLALADAQLVIAREYGFESWAALKHEVEAARRVAKFTPHPKFNEAVAAIEAGDLRQLDALLTANPELVRARTNTAGTKSIALKQLAIPRGRR